MTWPIEPPGIWLSLASSRAGRARPALFLDRDGVIVEDTGYLRSPEEVRLVDGIVALVSAANVAKVPVLVATNQSGIDRGLFGWEAFAAVEAEIARRLADGGARLDGVAACPFHPRFTAGYGAAHARWRKPAPGLIEILAERLNVDRGLSWMVGDKPRDIAAARRAGLAGALRLRHDRKGSGARAGGRGTFAVEEVASLAEARAFLEPRLFRARGAP